MKNFTVLNTTSEKPVCMSRGNFKKGIKKLKTSLSM